MSDALELWTHAGPKDPDAMPAGHAVVAFHDADGACILLAATGDARAFCARRLGNAGSPGAPARIAALACRSMFEAEHAYLQAARRLLPETYTGLIDAWKAWFLRLEPDRGVWSATNLHDAIPGSIYIGPMPDKHAPPKLGEALDDAFDLCRYPAELARAPAGRACPYKEMGRCPAPCDGSEPWDAFAARFRAAASALASRDAFVTAINDRMAEAAARDEFERAAHLKALASRIVGRGGRGLAHFAPLHAFARVAVVPNAAAGAAVALCRADGITMLGRLPPKPDAADAEALAERLLSVPPLPPHFLPDTHQREELGLICRRLFTARVPETYFTLAEAATPDMLLAAARRAPRPDPDAEPRTDRR